MASAAARAKVRCLQPWPSMEASGGNASGDQVPAILNISGSFSGWRAITCSITAKTSVFHAATMNSTPG